MSSSWVIKSDSYGERVYIRMRKIGWGGQHRYGLVKDASDATKFSRGAIAGLYAGRAGTIISRLFDPVQLGEVQ